MVRSTAVADLVRTGLLAVAVVVTGAVIGGPLLAGMVLLLVGVFGALTYAQHLPQRRAWQRVQDRKRTAVLESEAGLSLLFDGACRTCQAPLVLNARHCTACGAPTAVQYRICEGCGTRNPEDARYCCQCGAGL
jgi:hypothetical protein